MARSLDGLAVAWRTETGETSLGNGATWERLSKIDLIAGGVCEIDLGDRANTPRRQAPKRPVEHDILTDLKARTLPIHGAPRISLLSTADALITRDTSC
jgi:hypothetical protein